MKKRKAVPRSPSSPKRKGHRAPVVEEFTVTIALPPLRPSDVIYFCGLSGVWEEYRRGPDGVYRWARTA